MAEKQILQSRPRPSPRLHKHNVREFRDINLIIGDLNMPFINWSQYTSDNRRDCLLDCISECGLEQLVSSPTHIAGNLLDCAFTRMPQNINNEIDTGNIGTSDHSALIFDVNTKIVKNNSSEKVRQ